MKRFASSALLFCFCLSVAAASKAANSFVEVVASQFSLWDINHDGILSVDELDAAVANAAITNQNAAAVAALKRAARHGRKAAPFPPLTLQNIRDITGRREPNLQRMYEEGLARLAGVTHSTLFADGPPRLESIHQGKLGNCFSLAPLGAMVHRDPAQVASLFVVQSNGDYRVRLGKQFVEITPPTDAEIAMTSSNETGSLWLNIYEKAVGQARNEERAPDERLGSPLDALARGGSAGTMLAMLTGHEITRFSFKFAKDTAVTEGEFTNKLAELREQLTLATSQTRLMTCGTIKTTTPGLTRNHAYAVLYYEASKDAVELWNPHGQTTKVAGKPGPANGYPTTNGIFWIPVPEFVRQFSGMAFEVIPSDSARN